MNACDVQVFLYLPLWMVEVADRFQFSSFHRQHTVTTTTTTQIASPTRYSRAPPAV